MATNQKMREQLETLHRDGHFAQMHLHDDIFAVPTSKFARSS